MNKKKLWTFIKYLNKIAFYLGIYVYVENRITEEDEIINLEDVEY